MLTINKAKKTIMVLLAGLTILTACNKELPEAVPIDPPPNGTTPTIATLLDDPSFSILKAAVTRAGLMSTLADPTLRLTVFAPDDAAFIASGLPLFAITDVLTVEQVTGLVMYHVAPQLLGSADIPDNILNLQYPTILNPVPNNPLTALLRLTLFPSKRGTNAWVNNIPILGADIIAVNGIIHKVARVVAPPSQDLWRRINTDPNLTYLKAAIERADSGVAAGGRLQDALNTALNPSAIASNLTIFAPNDASMKLFLTGAITRALLSQVTPQPPNALDSATALATASYLVTTYGTLLLTNPYAISPALGATITPTLAQGIVAYHILSRQAAPYTPPGVRAFSVNIWNTATNVKTLLNSGLASHFGLTVQATFSPVGVTAITVKGVANAMASNVAINPLPGGTSDQHYVNGVIHVIDQVLLPQ